MATYICDMTAVSFVPIKVLICKFCFINLNSLCKALHKLFKECKQYLGLGCSQNTDFDGQIADTTLALVTHKILTLQKRFGCYEAMGGLFCKV